MKAKLRLFITAVLGLLVFCPAAVADWTEPVPLTEVNSNYYEKSPFLSFDGLTLYFSRIEAYGFYGSRMYQATRTMPVGPFTEVKEISTLSYPGGGVSYAWVSPDNLRMYYFYKQQTTRFRLAVSKRESVSEPWQIGTDISELNALGDVINQSLSADEMTIVFNGQFSGRKGDYDIWVATRPDANAPFTNVTNLVEINSSAADVHPSISPDGLTLYFASNRNGTYQLFRATRNSLGVPFGDLEHLSFFDCPDCSFTYPFLSSDGKAFYFTKSIAGAPLDIWVSYASEVPSPQTLTYYVDAVDGNDNNNGLTPQTAFATIQKGINTAEDGNTVLVYPGLYREGVDFLGKAVTVRGVPASTGIPVIEKPGDFAVSVYNGEEPNSILENFVIRNSFIALFIAGSSPTISNLTIIGNDYGAKCYAGSDPAISNCIFLNNTEADLIGCQACYSRTSEQGQGNIEDDPCFIDPNNGDYHLKSQAGRWDPNNQSWVRDEVTSPCIDGGDPLSLVGRELFPNGGRVNMGIYGGTVEASKSYFGEPVCEDAIGGDVNGDCRVDFRDFMIMALHWCEDNNP